MEKTNNTNNKNLKNQGSDKLPSKNKPEPDDQNIDKHASKEDIENDLNSKIMKITNRIREHHPEFYGFLEEMPETIPSEKNAGITLRNLSTYYESLNSMLNKYKLDYPKIEE